MMPELINRAAFERDLTEALARILEKARRNLVNALYHEGFTQRELAKTTFARELVSLAEACETTRGIKQVFFHRRFPVDVRHNAKIHRLQLTKYFANLRPVSLP
jgi:hypothetical protein